MKIAEENGDNDQKEAAKVNFGMANASLKWGNHVEDILQNLDNSRVEQERKDKEFDEEDDEEENDTKLPDINDRKV
jgi:hypothetical protein